jgi:hypothetical protein
MVPLPDGTFMIMNGAYQGVAGFGKLSSDPNLRALLYDPSQPVNQRISILNTTIVPRMYHSEVNSPTNSATFNVGPLVLRLYFFPMHAYWYLDLTLRIRPSSLKKCGSRYAISSTTSMTLD